MEDSAKLVHAFAPEGADRCVVFPGRLRFRVARVRKGKPPTGELQGQAFTAFEQVSVQAVERPINGNWPWWPGFPIFGRSVNNGTSPANRSGRVAWWYRPVSFW